MLSPLLQLTAALFLLPAEARVQGRNRSSRKASRSVKQTMVVIRLPITSTNRFPVFWASEDTGTVRVRPRLLPAFPPRAAHE